PADADELPFGHTGTRQTAPLVAGRAPHPLRGQLRGYASTPRVPHRGLLLWQAGDLREARRQPRSLLLVGVLLVTVTIYHNPACGTSRNTLEMIRRSGEEPEVVEYLQTPPSRERLVELIGAMGIRPRELLREKGTPYAELGLGDPALSDDEIVDAMMVHPILINRPIVVTEKGAALCRPSEKVLSLLSNPVATFTKEDGETVAAPGAPA